MLRVIGQEEKKMMLDEAAFMRCRCILEILSSARELKLLAVVPGIRSEHRLRRGLGRWRRTPQDSECQKGPG